MSYPVLTVSRGKGSYDFLSIWMARRNAAVFVMTADPMPAGGALAERRSTDWLILVLPPLFWAGNFVVGRAIRDSIPAMTLSFGRWTVALVCLLPFAWRALRRDWPAYLALRWQLLAVSAVGVAAFNSLVYTGLETTSATNGLLMNSLIPLLVVAFGAMFYGHRLRLGEAAGLLLSFAGVLTLISGGSLSRLAGLSFAQGDLIVFSAMVCWALYTLWLRRLPAGLDRIGLMAAQIVVALVLLAPFFLAEWSVGLRPVWSIGALAALGYVGIFPSVLAYLLYTAAVGRFGPARAGMTIHLMPVFGAILAMAFLDERLRPFHLAGFAAIVGGLVCSNRAGRQGDGG